ncbi:MAB_1171c family putative transporter [Streptomyces sp. Tue6028]|uniref:MAB_1171c family putative transporter n=1 Tax=Streptomyces sp. Tue6028 TaxID=2036037 RepID=UPI003D71A90F
MNGDAIFYMSGGMLLLACLLKAPALIRARGRDRLLASICALLLVGAGVLITSAESVIVGLRKTTGITNVAAPVVYILLTAFSGASIVLIVHWRGGDKTQVRRLSRITIVTYGIVSAAIGALFTLGSAPVERRSDFDLYYADTPYIREMIVLYLVAHAAASLTAGRLCWRWSKEVHRALRVGLRILAGGYFMHYGVYDPAAGMAVVGRWAGHNWDVLITIARAMTAPSAVLVAVGFIIPLLGHRGDDALRYWQLAPLEKVVASVEGACSPVPLPLPWWRPSLRLRLTHRQTFIAEQLLACQSAFDTRVRDWARSQALASAASRKRSDDESGTAAIGDAAMIAAAVEQQHRAAGQSTDHSVPVPDYSSDLASISAAMRSPIVKGVRRRARRTSDVALWPELASR